MPYDCSPVEKEGERNIWCQHYEECLDYVASEFWMSWDCSSCRHQSDRNGKIEVALHNSDQTGIYESIITFSSDANIT